MEKDLSKFKNWLENNPKNYSQNSIQAYLADITIFNRYLTSINQDLAPGKLQEQFKKFMSHEISEGRNYTTLRRRIASLRRYSAFLAEDHKISDVNMKALVALIEDQISVQTEEDVLTKEEISKILAYLSDEENNFHTRDETIFRLLLETGSSIQRILNVELDDVDLEKNEITLSNDLDEKFSLKLDKGTVKSINSYINEARANVASSGELSALFISQQGRRISRQAVWQNLKKLGELTGLGTRLNARLIKNTAVKRILAQDIPVEQIRMTLGHKNALSTYALIRKTRNFSQE